MCVRVARTVAAAITSITIIITTIITIIIVTINVCGGSGGGGAVACVGAGTCRRDTRGSPHTTRSVGRVRGVRSVWGMRHSRSTAHTWLCCG